VDQVGQTTRDRVVLLSTGLFDCALPTFDDPQLQAEALAELTTGACREDARHVVLYLYKEPGLSWSGTYPLRETPEDPGGRAADAAYLGVEEAAATTSEGLVPGYQPVDVTRYFAQGEPGEVRVRQANDTVLSGHFDLQEPHVSGSFRAEQCDQDAELFALLVSSPIASCSLVLEE
jgi:hypothetical protein